MKDNCGRVKWAGLLLALALAVAGCNDLFFETPEFDNPYDPKNAGPHTITFDSAGGTAVAPITQAAGTPITRPTDPTRDSYLFIEWDPELPDTMPADDMTLVARWMHEDLAALEYRDMDPVPGGTFTQQPTTGDSFEHTISNFEIARYQVTYELWYTVRHWAETNGYVFANSGREGHDGTDGAVPTAEAEHEPVTTVSWRDTIVWLNAYSEMRELTPVYYTDAEQTIPIKSSIADDEFQTEEGSIDNPYVDWGANGYRLPTEGEWQYAASYRDGTDWTPFNHASGATDDYNNVAATEAVAWYDINSSSKTQPVGIKTANQLGIHDMSGNVRDRAWDWWGNYPPGPESDYRGTPAGLGRVFRGGGWLDTADFLQVGLRNYSAPWDSYDIIGFRPARTVP